MPLYEYECLSCHAQHEALRSMKDADTPIACPKCGAKKSKRLQSVVAAVTSGGESSSSKSLPMGGCGRCGDPRGSCSLN